VVAVPIVPRAAGEDVCAFEVFTARLATTAEAFGWWEEPHAATAADAATASVIAVTRCRFRVGDVEIISSV
jgi:hypothetical protein